MAVKIYKPTSPGRRGMSGATFEEVTRDRPERSLLVPKKRHGGRNVHGRVTVRHRGGGRRPGVRLGHYNRGKRGTPARGGPLE